MATTVDEVVTYPGARRPDRVRAVSSSGLRLAVYEWGPEDGPPLLLAHGGFDFAGTFDVFAPMLADAGYRCVSWDHRGHGDSEHSVLYNWSADVRDALVVLDSVTDRPLPVIGHSKGGGLMLELTDACPHRVSHVVNLDGLPSNNNWPDVSDRERTRMVQGEVQRWLDHRRAVIETPRRPGTIDELAERRRRMNPRLEHDWVRYLVTIGARHDDDGWRWKIDPVLRPGGFGPWRPEWTMNRVPGIGVPFLGVLGLEPEQMGWGTVPDDVRPYLPPGARFVPLDGVGHFVHIEQPRLVADLVLDLLSTTPPTSSSAPHSAPAPTRPSSRPSSPPSSPPSAPTRQSTSSSTQQSTPSSTEPTSIGVEPPDRPAPMPDRSVEVGDGRIRWVRSRKADLALHRLRDGRGRPLLLLHGLAESAPAEVPTHLAPWSGPVVALDFTGHGRSTIPAGGGYTAEALMADVDAALTDLGPATVLGRGLGAYIALLIAGARPALVRGAILADGSGLIGGGIRPASPSLVAIDPDQNPVPDPHAVAELSRDVRPPDYAAEFVRMALASSDLDAPITVSTIVRPEWLAGVVAEYGVVERPLDQALAAYAELD